MENKLTENNIAEKAELKNGEQPSVKPEVESEAVEEPDLPKVPQESEDSGSDNQAEIQHISVSDIELTLYEVSLYAGESKMPIVTMSPHNASDKREIWTSSDNSVATVTDIGKITGISEGECTITVTSADNPEVYAVVSVRVIPDAECTYIDGILIVNKTYPLPRDYAPGWETEATPHLWEMIAAAEADGIKLWISSGYRSYYDQEYIYNRYVARDGQSEADRYSARPGHSEHQSGLAYDLNDLSHDFGETPEGIWVAENCHKFGFIIRYPEDKESITGYIYEPWHIRYLGVEKATQVYESGLCLEEFLGITSVYS